MIDATTHPRAVAFFDIDGTLARHFLTTRNANELPSQAVQDAVREFVEAGNVAFLSTGRSPKVIHDVIRDLPFSGMVCADGGYVEFEGVALKDAAIANDLVEELVQEILDAGIAGGFEGMGGIFEVNDTDRRSYELPLVRSLDDLHEMYPDPHVWKVNVEGDDWDILVRRSHILDRLGHFYAGEGQHELAAVGVNKGAGAKLLLQAVRRSPQHVICFGDSPNDIPIFELCDIAVAMGNSNDRTKAAADMVTDDVEHDGVASGLMSLRPFWERRS